MAARFGLAFSIALLVIAPAAAQTVIIDETFDQYTSQGEFESAWTPDLGSGYQPSATSNGFLVPVSGVGVPPYNNPTGLQGNGVNIFSGINEYNGPAAGSLANLVPTPTQSIKLSGDLFDAGAGNLDHRSMIAIRNDTVNRGEFGVNGYNFLEMGLYNAGAEDPTQPAGTALPPEKITGYAYRLTLWNLTDDPENPLLRNPNYGYFPLDIALDEDANGRVQQTDIGEGWHRYTATIGVDSVTLTLDLYRDGINNATNQEGVDSTVTWQLTPHNDATEPNPFDPFNSLRIGGPSGSASANEAVVDNVKLETVAVVAPGDDADFDGDGDVDGADFLTWQRGLGTAGDLADGDADGDGNITADDLQVWKDQFGPGAPAAPTVGAIPEPATVALVAAAMLAGLAATRRRS